MKQNEAYILKVTIAEDVSMFHAMDITLGGMEVYTSNVSFG